MIEVSGQVSSDTSGRLSVAEAVELYRKCSLLELGRMAHEVTLAMHPEEYRTYVVDRNINYSNWCSAKCSFCSFKVNPGCGSRRESSGYVLSLEEIGAKIEELVAIGGTQVLLQGGLVPPEILPFEWYEDLLRYIKSEFPAIHIHAFSPPEIHAFSQVFEMELVEVLSRLRAAGLDTIPGGGAEILSNRVRSKIGVGKTNTVEYLDVMRQAHMLGMRTSITMMFGHIETIEERMEHLRLIRELQDETGGFTAFICWTFQPAGTALGKVRQFPVDYAGLPDGRHLMLAGAHTYLKQLAISRLFLDNIENMQCSWVTQGPGIGQLALFYGANDMGSVMMEENVVSAAGTTFRLEEVEIRRLIEDCGWLARRRNCYYEVVET